MRPIDLDKALLAVCSGCNEEFSEEPCEPGCCRIREKLENAPTLALDDLRPKGRWVKHSRYSEPECDVCGSGAAAGYDEEPWETPFCPFCGADMQGGGEDA